MLIENLKLSGRVIVAMNGQVIQEIPNLVVDTGKDFVASRMKEATTAVMSHMAVGTNTTAAAAGDTALGAESARVALSSTTVSSNAVSYVATFSAGVGTGALTEAAIFNAASGGIMLCRTLYPVINKGASDEVTVTWEVSAS